MATFVLIPGACHGGWWFEPLARRLREHGHEAYAITLTGLGDRAHLMTAAVNLDTHIQDVVSLLENEQIEDAILVGHSYAGMVVAGAADRASERTDALVYVDAFAPGDGDSAWSLTDDAQRRWYIEGASADGLGIAPLPFFDRRSTPHPLATTVQRLRLTDPARAFRRRDYVYAADFADSPFASTYERLRDDPDWNVHALASGHNVMRDAPEELLKLLLDVAAR